MDDMLIVGAGPAGLTAALYALRYGYKATVFEGLSHGGQVAETSEVENYPAIERITGYELAVKLYEQVVNLGATMVNEKVIGIDVSHGKKKVITSGSEYEGKTIIIANGAKRRKLNCPGEEKLSGYGVSYCATCDGNFFRGKEVAIVGGGNTALEDALFLANICKKVYIIHRRDSFRGMKTLVNSVVSNPKISIIYNSQITSINGKTVVESINLKTDNGESKLEISGVFIAIGTEPENGFLSDIIALDENGYIISDENCETEVAGIFVAGDSRTKKLRQIVTATADGAVAAFMAANHLGSENSSSTVG